MSLTVVKLGSTLVADDAGDVRSRRAARGVPPGGRDPRRRRVRRRSSPPARSRSACAAWGCPCARPRSRSCRPRPRSGRGRCTTCTPACWPSTASSAAQVLLTFFDVSAREQYVNARRTLAKLLEWGVVPIINENDTTATDEISFGDNDILAAQVAILMSADLLVVLSDVDGLFTSDPARDPRRGAGLRGDAIWPSCSDYEIGMSSSHVGSGGMRSKVLCAEMATAAGIPVVICNGTEPGTLLRAVAGRAGRHAVPSRRPSASRASSCGCATRSPRAASCASTRARSGRCASRGPACCRWAWWRSRASSRPATPWTSSPPGDGDRQIGKGISNLSAEELRRVKGMKSAAGARGPAARQRGGRAPRLLRARPTQHRRCAE